MMKKAIVRYSLLVLPFLVLILISQNAYAGHDGIFSYTISDSTATITGYTGPGGHLQIPDVIEGVPVTQIGDSAFAGNTSLTGVKIPKGIITIGDKAFQGCTSLTSANLPNELTTIGAYAFAGCIKLVDFRIPKDVVQIGDYAFSGLSELTDIQIPKAVANIGKNVFADCGKLMSIDAASDNQYYTSVDGILYNKAKTVIVAYPGGRKGPFIIPAGIDKIVDGAFAGCTELTSVVIPDGVTSIGSRAFADCTGITSVIIPNSVISIGDQAFSGCTKLSLINLPNGLDTISSGLFSDCSSLKNIEIPSGVASIGDKSFYHCGLTEVIIPEYVTSIGDDAFNGCGNLEKVTLLGIAPELGEDVFDNCAPGLKIYYINGSYGYINPWHGYEMVSLYTVAYDGNGYSEGTLPIDDHAYSSGDSAIILGNIGSIGRNGYVFEGWNTEINGKGTNYSAGESVVFGTQNIKLYAKWTSLTGNDIEDSDSDINNGGTGNGGNNTGGNNTEVGPCLNQEASAISKITITNSAVPFSLTPVALSVNVIYKDKTSQTPDNSLVTWNSSDPTVATVNFEGVVTFTGLSGKTKITAQIGSRKCEKLLAVNCTLTASSEVTTNPRLNKTHAIVINASYDSGVTKRLHPAMFVWRSNNSSIATVDNKGNIICTGKPGTVIISGTLQKMKVSLTTTIKSKLAISGIKNYTTTSTNIITTVLLGETMQVADAAKVVYSSSNGAVAKVDKSGVITFTGKPGTVKISVAYMGMTASQTIEIAAKYSIPETLAYAANPQKLTVVADYGTGIVYEVSNSNIVWASSNAKVAKVDASGTVTYTGESGSVTITATVFGQKAQITATISK